MKKKLLWAISTALIIFAAVIIYSYSTLTFTQEEKDFLYLSQVIYDVTHDIEDDEEKLAALSEWLNQNVKHVSKYPPSFNGQGVANVVRGGVGNCGYQSCNISVMADMLGMEEHRIFHYNKDLGSPYQHAFAEIKVNGEWKIYDPDRIIYQRGPGDKVMGVEEMLKNPELVQDSIFRVMMLETRRNPDIFKLTRSWQPMIRPYGEEGYKNFASWGGTGGFKWYLSFENNLTAAAILSLLGAAAVWIFLFVRKSSPVRNKKLKKK